jgi:hypothetical protein
VRQQTFNSCQTTAGAKKKAGRPRRPTRPGTPRLQADAQPQPPPACSAQSQHWQSAQVQGEQLQQPQLPAALAGRLTLVSLVSFMAES